MQKHFNLNELLAVQNAANTAGLANPGMTGSACCAVGGLAASAVTPFGAHQPPCAPGGFGGRHRKLPCRAGPGPGARPAAAAAAPSGWQRRSPHHHHRDAGECLPYIICGEVVSGRALAKRTIGRRYFSRIHWVVHGLQLHSQEHRGLPACSSCQAASHQPCILHSSVAFTNLLSCSDLLTTSH